MGGPSICWVVGWAGPALPPKSAGPGSWPRTKKPRGWRGCTVRGGWLLGGLAGRLGGLHGGLGEPLGPLDVRGDVFPAVVGEPDRVGLVVRDRGGAVSVDRLAEVPGGLALRHRVLLAGRSRRWPLGRGHGHVGEQRVPAGAGEDPPVAVAHRRVLVAGEGHPVGDRVVAVGPLL